MKSRLKHALASAPKWILIIVVLLIAARAALPWAVKSYVNRTLDSIPGYYGRIDDIDVSLWRGAYAIEGVKLLKTDGDAQEPFFNARKVDIALDWRALWKGTVKTKITLHEPQLQFVQRATQQASQTAVDKSWQVKVRMLYPFQVNRFVVRNGLVRYKDETSAPRVNIYLDNLDLTATNLSNADRSGKRLPSEILATARVLKSGQAKVRAEADLLDKPFEADVNASIRQLSLKELNEFAKAYGGFDFEKGEIDVTTELAVTKQKYDGYVKTLMRDVDIVDLRKETKEGESAGNLIWQGLVGAIMGIFKNQDRDQFAARIPVTGSRADMKIDSWATVGSILKNTFIKALSPDFEESVEIPEGKTRAPASER